LAEKERMSIVRSFPRIHIGLLDLGSATYRKYGGAGFAIDGLPVIVEATPSLKTNIIGLDQLDRRGRLDVHAALNRLKKLLPTARADITIRNLPPQHVGFGSKTALLMGIIEAVVLASGLQLDRCLIQYVSGRGGTSGIGINIFFTGGFLIDGGHDPVLSKDFAPSSVRRYDSLPPIVCHAKIPSQWRFHLVLPTGKKYSGDHELEFFQKNTPIPKLEVLKSLALVYHGIAPAVITNNLELLRVSLAQLHEVGFKQRELRGQSKAVRDILKALNKIPSCAAGLSSLGPLLYVIADKKNADVERIVPEICERYDARHLGIFQGRNRGFEVIT
jgi:beta-ribofuranosylaminobenzene 5'-phosphate synthase